MAGNDVPLIAMGNSKGALGENKKNSPAPPDFVGAAEEQSAQNAKLNRPDISTPTATQHWEQGPDGQWHLTTGFAGPLAGANDAVSGQLANTLSKPFDLSGLPALDSGAGARQQAIDAAYGESTKRLDPQWQQREGQLRQRLANQGLDPDSEAGQGALQQLGQERSDAYGSAMNSAIAQGTAAGDSVFRNSAMARQMALAEALRQRGQPLAEMEALQGLLQMPGFAQLAGPQLLSAVLAKHQGDVGKYEADNAAWTDLAGGIGDLLGLGAKALPFLL